MGTRRVCPSNHTCNFSDMAHPLVRARADGRTLLAFVAHAGVPEYDFSSKADGLSRAPRSQLASPPSRAHVRVLPTTRCCSGARLFRARRREPRSCEAVVVAKIRPEEG